MPTEYAWFLPTLQAGDGHKINAKEVERPPTVDYISKVARAAEEAGFVNLLVPTGTHCMDGWVMAAAVGQHVKKIKFCVAFRPGLSSPVFAAQTANTVDTITGGRLTVNVVTGSTIVDQKRYGDHLPHDERYKRTDEFIEIVKCIWQNKGPVTFKGQYYDIAEATFFPDVVSRPFPPVYLGGSSEAGRLVGAKHSDIHMMYAVELESIAKDVIDMKQRAAEFGRENQIKFGIRMHVICRETRAEARKTAEALLKGSDLSNTGAWADMRNKTESAGQSRINELAGRGSLWITDTLWMGVNTVRAGAGASLVGTPDMIASALKEYVQVGVETFILSGWPHVEEAEIFGKEVMPLLEDTDPFVL